MTTQIAWRYRQHELDQHHAQLLAEILLDTGHAMPEPSFKTKLPGDERALRGIPAIGRNVQGAINGTRPGAR